MPDGNRFKFVMIFKKGAAARFLQQPFFASLTF